MASTPVVMMSAFWILERIVPPSSRRTRWCVRREVTTHHHGGYARPARQDRGPGRRTFGLMRRFAVVGLLALLGLLALPAAARETGSDKGYGAGTLAHGVYPKAGAPGAR